MWQIKIFFELINSPPDCHWIIYLVSWDVVDDLKKEKKRGSSCLFPRDLTIIHTMNLLTFETPLCSQCEDVVFLLAVT